MSPIGTLRPPRPPRPPRPTHPTRPTRPTRPKENRRFLQINVASPNVSRPRRVGFRNHAVGDHDRRLNDSADGDISRDIYRRSSNR